MKDGECLKKRDIWDLLKVNEPWGSWMRVWKKMRGPIKIGVSLREMDRHWMDEEDKSEWGVKNRPL